MVSVKAEQGQAEGCDVLLCEAESALVPVEGEQVHHTPEDTGDTASTAGAGRLIVTHVGHFLAPQQAVARTSARFGGPVDQAAPDATF
jgi:ribonuclease BN (tRNA processing enzyme)